MTSTWMTTAKMKRKKEPPHDTQRRKTVQSRRTAPLPGAHDVRHRFHHRLAESLRHGHGPGGLAVQGYCGDRGAASLGLSEGSVGPTGEVTAFGSRAAGHLSGQPVRLLDVGWNP